KQSRERERYPFASFIYSLDPTHRIQHYRYRIKDLFDLYELPSRTTHWSCPKRSARHFNPVMYDQIKAEINHLLHVGFIRSCRYADWIYNIVHVEKKDSGKIIVCIDFRDLNKATPKDEYPMPIA